MRFAKLSGAGNDFLLVEGARAPSIATIRAWCDRRSGVGADGVLWVRRSAGKTPHRVVYWNVDGSRAFCGNGTRCAAWWLSLQGAGRKLALKTQAGPVAAVVEGPGRVRVAMPGPRRLRLGLELEARGQSWTAHAVEIGVPHAVVEVENLDRFPVPEIGRALRRHRVFGTRGANVDFVERSGRSRYRIRTYERGVEGETLACGSGAAAAAFVLESIGRDPLPISLTAGGGDTLIVSRREGTLWLEGPARVTFTGEIEP